MKIPSATRREWISRRALTIVLAGLVTGCGPFIEVVKVDPAASDALRNDITIYETGTLMGLSFKPIQPLTATSCKNMLWDPPASEEDATNQLRLKALKLGANGLLDVKCGGRSGTSLLTNCWESVSCSATAIQVTR